jgi:hypothetical protein
LLKATDINQLNQPRQSDQPKQLGHFTFALKNDLKWKDRYEIDKEPSFENVFLSYLPMVSYGNICIIIQVALKEIHKQVNTE